MSHFPGRVPHAVAILAVTVLFLHPAEAQARSVTHPDPRGDLVDVFALNYDEGGVPKTSPRQANGDIVQVRLRHRTNRIRARITFAELRRTGTTHFFAGLSVKTNEGIRRQVMFDTSRENKWKQETWLERPSAVSVPCAIHHSLDYVNNVLVLGIPRACVGRPRWVQMSFHAHLGIDRADNKAFHYKDDALRDGLRADDSQFPTRYTLSSRLYRG